jgi:hypothetical protein
MRVLPGTWILRALALNNFQSPQPDALPSLLLFRKNTLRIRP